MVSTVRLLFLTCIVLGFSLRLSAQITSNTSDYVQPTQYTNGMPNDEIFVFCSPDVNGIPVTGSLTASPTIAGPGYTFEWGLYDDNTHIYTTFQTDNGPTSTINNLASGGYNVTITNNAGETETFITWVYVSTVESEVDLALDPVNPGCEPFDVNGTISATDFTYWDPLEPGQEPFVIDQNTTIEVCFSANHTWVSDLGFVLIGPPSCGSPAVTLSPNPQVVNNANGCCCNNGDNVNNLCFSTASNNQFAMCNAGTPLTGTFGFYNGTYPGTGGGNYPQGGVAGLYGCNAAEGGWAVQIYDCIGQDVGALTSASITFSNGTSTIIYDSGAINSAINDNSCDPNTASIYVVPLTTPVIPDPQQVPNQGTLTYQLGLNGNPVSLAPGTNNFTEHIDPIPTYDEWYYLTIQDQLGCSAEDSVMFDFTGYADATIDPINPTNQLCTGNQPVQLTAATAGGTWSGNGVSAGGIFDPVAAGSGTHTITYTIADPCGDIQTMDITVGELTVNSATTASVCTADNGTATITPLTGSAPYTYTWATTPVQSTQTATNLPSGDYDVTIEDTDGCSIATTVTIPFDASNLAVAINTQTDASCNGICDGEATALASGGTTPIIYGWDDPNNQLTATASGLCAGTYNVGVVDDNGCLATAQVEILEPTPLSVTAVMDEESDCGQANGEATATALGGVAAIDYQYSWDSNPVQNTATATGLLPATYTVTATDDNGCTATNTVEITTTLAIAVNINTSTDATCFQGCDGEATATPSANAVAPVTYSWNSTPPQLAATANNLCAGEYVVTATDNVGCIATDTIVIAEPTELSATVAASETQICIGQSTDLNSTISGGTPPINTVTWTASPADPTLVTTSQNPTASPIVTTTYEFVAEDANGCASAVQSVVVNVAEPLDLSIIRPAFSSDTAICRFDAATIDLEATGGDGNYSIFLLPDVSTPVQLPMQVLPNTTTTYDFMVEDGCGTPEAFATSVVTVHQLPTSNFVSDVRNGCQPLTVQFTDVSAPTPVSWDWNFGDAGSNTNTSQLQSPTHTFEDAGLYDINLSITSAEGCTNDTTFLQHIEVYPLPYANFEAAPQTTTLLEGRVEFTDLTIGDVAEWDWSFGDGEVSDLQNPENTYLDTGSFMVNLHVVTTDGCEGSDRQFVVIEPDFMFYVPNAFSPNGDRKNDSFRGYGTNVKWETYEMSIYNRWGEEIYFTNNVDEPWNGIYKGAQAPEEVYVWMIQLFDQKGEKHTFRGRVTLFR